MKRSLVWTIGVGGAAVALALVMRSGGQESAVAVAENANAAAPAQAPAVPAQPAGEEAVAFTFEDDAKLEEFTNLWQQRQGIILRMTVLRAYWNEEQAALTQLEGKLTTDYKLDLNKNYILNRERRALIEQPAPPAEAQTPPVPSPDQATP